MYVVFLHNDTAHWIDYSINVIFVCTGKQKYLCDSLDCNDRNESVVLQSVFWNSKHSMNVRYYIYLRLPFTLAFPVVLLCLKIHGKYIR